MIEASAMRRPSMPAHPQTVVDHGGAVAVRPHPAGADRMEDGRADIAGGADQLGLALQLGARAVLARARSGRGRVRRRSGG